jgi:penicillin-binding protein 2
LSGFDFRLKTMGLFVGVLLITLTGRLWMLQLTQWVDFREKALQNRTTVVTTPAPRGLIYDRNGVVLAENRPNWTVIITPAELPPPSDQEERDRIVTFLASVLRDRDVSTADVREAIDEVCEASHFTPTSLGRFAEDLPFDLVAQIQERRSELPGVSVGQQFRRYYPYGRLASHLLGYARAISEDEYKQWKNLQFPAEDEGQTPWPTEPWSNDPVYKGDSVFGKDGIEAAYELDTSTDPPTPLLQGRRGMRVWEVDKFNRPIRLIREEREAQQGAGVYLTIDVELQKIAEDALNKAIGTKRTGAAILMDVNTGEVLALASEPSVDPNLWVQGMPNDQYANLAADKRLPFVNKAIAGTYPPGSIFKLVTSLAALETTEATPQTSAECRGFISVGSGSRPWVYKCWKNHGGYLDMYEGLAQSCDVYFYELVRRHGLTSTTIAAFARMFGIGSPTGCGLPGELAGRVPDPEWKADELDEDWYLGDSLQYVMGQSYLLVTPMQMAVMTAAVANGGKVMAPQLVRKIQWPGYLERGTTLFRGEVVSEVQCDPENLKTVQEGARHAVTSRNGTARGLANLGFSVAGKTGSAQFGPPGTETHAWFVCWAPYENPRFACTVLVTEGGGGSEAAAPIAREIISAAMARYENGQVFEIQSLLPEEGASAQDPEAASGDSDEAPSNEPIGD